MPTGLDEAVESAIRRTEQHGEALEAAVLEEMLAAHERQLDEALDHVIGVLVAARAARARRRRVGTEPGSEPPGD